MILMVMDGYEACSGCAAASGAVVEASGAGVAGAGAGAGAGAAVGLETMTRGRLTAAGAGAVGVAAAGAAGAGLVAPLPFSFLVGAMTARQPRPGALNMPKSCLRIQVELHRIIRQRRQGGGEVTRGVATFDLLADLGGHEEGVWASPNSSLPRLPAERRCRACCR